ncbi:hypothetical protein LEP1GSC127_3134 [Leptospira kirschneri str. 200801925]|nr:hypothetical protein LEP1GSC127_3134 [Leptospira kirschneri str. 200801925]
MEQRRFCRLSSLSFRFRFFYKEFEKADRNFSKFQERMKSLIDLSIEERKTLLKTKPAQK